MNRMVFYRFLIIFLLSPLTYADIDPFQKINEKTHNLNFPDTDYVYWGGNSGINEFNDEGCDHNVLQKF